MNAAPPPALSVAPYLVIAAVAVVGSATFPLIALILETDGVSETLIGVNAAIGSAAILLAGPLSPRLIDQFGPARFMSACVAALILSLLLFPISDDYLWRCLTRFMMGGAVACLFVATEYWIVAGAPAAKRGRAVAVYVAIVSLGFAVGPSMLAVTGVEGWTPFLTLSLLVALVGPAPILAARGAAALFKGGERADDVQSFRRQWADVFWYFRYAPVLIGAVALYGAAEFGAGGLLPIWGLRSGLSQEASILLSAAFALGGIVFQPVFAWANERGDPTTVLALAAFGCLIGAAAAPLLAGLEAGPWSLFAAMAFWGGVSAGLYTSALVAAGAQYYGKHLAAANAALVTAYGVGAFLGPFVAGAAMEKIGDWGLFAVIGAAAAIYATAALRAIYGQRPRAT